MDILNLAERHLNSMTMEAAKTMGRKQKNFNGQQQAFEAVSQQAEDNQAAATETNRNQKGQIPNKPSTG
ncbi:hypothetical protein DFQ01_12952 [Paenibacillus cellulosilyticus]|uniref:Uncharacterized protein n=1 Tax=Paenibacillus cellulosilyticus TaxID=375489 RepID=A0A2V2YQ86_9BACL|nr:hypothetical protein DFQ01_12952 [Paenibacillus cellulosilyticus]